MHFSTHFIFFQQCAHFNALYFRNERVEQLCSAVVVTITSTHFTYSRRDGQTEFIRVAD